MRWLLFFGLGLGIHGCQGYERARECARIAQVTNTALASIRNLDSADENAPSSEVYGTISERYDQLEKELGEIEKQLIDRELTRSLATLRTSLRVAAREAQQYGASLLELQSLQQQDNAQAKLVRARKRLTRGRDRMQKNLQSYQAARERIDRSCAIR